MIFKIIFNDLKNTSTGCFLKFSAIHLFEICVKISRQLEVIQNNLKSLESTGKQEARQCTMEALHGSA